MVHGYAQLVGQAPQTVYEMQRGIFLKKCKTKVAMTLGFDVTVLMRVRRDHNTY